VLQTRPCEGCALEKNGAAGDDAAVEIGVLEKPDGYYVVTDKGDRRISTFILVPISVFVEPSQVGGVDRRVGTLVEIMRDGEVLGQLMMAESGWDSKAAIKGEFRGIQNFSFTGTDDDVQRIKHLVFREDRDMGEIIQVYEAGMRAHRVGKRDLMVYVEPGLSINQLRVQGTHVFQGKIPAPPELKNYTLPQVEDAAVTEALLALLDTNEDAITAQVVGWFVACHLKAHLMRRYTQFPLLMVWGNSGAGKSAATSLMAMLNGCDYTTGHSALNLSSITPWALIHYASCTTTVPRLLEEYNKSKIRTSTYNFIGEIMKAAFNANVIGRGTLSGSSANGRGKTGAELAEISICAPLVIISEQAPQMTALQQRGIQVMLSSGSRKGKTASFLKASAMRAELGKLAKALMVSALTTDLQWVEDTLDSYASYIPDGFLERPSYSYQVALTGLAFLGKVCRDLKLDVDDRLQELQDALSMSLDGSAVSISQAKNRTEVDAVLEDIGVMATVGNSGGQQWIVPGKHYAFKDGLLVLDVPVVHAMYKMFKRASKDNVVIDSVAQFSTLLQQEPYFVTDKMPMLDMVQARPVTALDMEKMTEKGIDVSMFKV
jgi:hypothetical protein